MMRRLLLLSGIAASVLYVVADVLGALRYPGYSYVDQTISELSAFGAPSRPLMLVLFGLYPALVLLFSGGVWLVAGRRRSLRVIAGLLGVYAIACIPFAPMHTREVLAAGGDTWSDTMHLVMTGIDSLLLMAIIVVGAWTFGRGFRRYSIVTLIVMVVGGAYTSVFASALEANEPTPWIGLSERITVFSAMLWLAVLSVVLLRDRSFASVRVWIRHHPALAYFTLAFAISWGGIIAVVGPRNILASKALFESYVWVAPLVLGPAIAGLVSAWAVGGLRAYGRRLVRWRVGARWYAIALFVAPVYYAVTALVLSREPNIVVAADRATLVVQGVIIALAAGIFEELGWTGFGVPALRRRFTATTTGVIVGVLWGLWHVLPELLGARAFDLVPYIAVHLLAVVVGLTGFRVLMTWVYERTQSTLIGILMHASLTASLLMLQPVVAGRSLLVVGIVLDLVPWLIVAAVAVARLDHPRRVLA